MITLYQTPGACSLAPLIALHATGLAHATITVDVRARRLADGSDYLAVNPKGAVPALRTDGGEVLTEVAVLLQYIAGLAPAAGLIPTDGLARYRQLELVNFIATEVHKGFPPPKMFFPDYPEAAWNITAEAFRRKLRFLADTLGDAPYLNGDGLTAADAYLFTILRSATRFGFDLSASPALIEYLHRLADHTAVNAALAEEGLG